MTNVVNNYQEINLTANITLQWTFTFGTGTVVSRINDINPNANGYTITLPAANAGALPLGQDILFNNISIYSFAVKDNAGNTLQLIASGKVYYFYLYDSSTAAGQWRVTLFGSGTNAITALTAHSSDNTITITNGSLTPPGGTINFQLPTSLTNLNNSINAVGFPVVTGTNPNTWGSVIFTAGTNIAITNPNGINSGNAANPIFNLDTDVVGLTSIQVGNVIISGHLITNTNTNQDININTEGTGNLYLNGIKIDPSGNLTLSGLFNNPYTPKAWCVFSDTISGSSHVIAIGNSSNVASITGSAGSYTIAFTTAMSNTNYGVLISLGNNSGQLDLGSVPCFAFWNLKQTTQVVISVLKGDGTLVGSAPNGITVVIMSL